MNPLAPMIRSIPRIAATAAVLLCAAAPPAQDPVPAAQPKPVRLDEWPALPETDKQRVPGLVGQFRKEGEALHAEARSQLVRLGPGAAPLLFLQVNDRPGNVNDQVFRVLDELLQPEHAALLARECKKNKLELRRYLVAKLACFCAPDMKPVLQAMTKDKDEEAAYFAHVGLAGLGEPAALPPLLEQSRKDWNSTRAMLASVLPNARGKAMGDAVAAHIAKAQPAAQAAGLRLLRYLGTEDHVPVARNLLSAEDNAVKKEAVNAMRALHGQEPIENLPVFQAIEMAKEWLQK